MKKAKNSTLQGRKKMAKIRAVAMLILAVGMLTALACNNNSGGGGGSGDTTALTPTAPTPTAPTPTTLTLTSVTPVAGSVTTGTVVLSWTEPTEADFSHVLISWTPTGGSTTQPLQVDKGTTMATITGLTTNVVSFTTISVDTAGNKSAASGTLAVTGINPPPSPVALTASTATTGTRVRLSWPAPTAADFSHVLISWTPTTGTSPTQPVQVNTGQTSVTITGFDTTSRSFTAVSVDNGGNSSAASTAVMATPTLRVAMFTLGARMGNFGIAACNTALTATSSQPPDILRLQELGYTKAVFFGATTTYSFPNIDTSTNALGISGVSATALTNRPLITIVNNSGTAVVATTFGTTPVAQTIGNVVNVGSSGLFQNNASDVLGVFGVRTGAGNRFWSFATGGGNYNTGNSCTGGTTASTSISGNFGNLTDVSVGGANCASTNIVLCAAR